jgi:mitochondrial fission protein ELM1
VLSLTKPTDGNILLINGATGPIDFDFAMINGEATAELLNNGTIKISRIIGGDNGAFKMVFTLKTGNDCEISYEFNHPSAGQIALNTSTLLKIN